MTNRRTWAVFGALIAAAGLAGCAPARPAGPADPTHVPSTADVVDLATRSGDWPPTENLLADTVDQLARKCVVAHGFNEPEPAKSHLPAPEDEAAAVDLPSRRTEGYGLTASERPQTPDAFYESLSAPEQRRFDVTFFGPSDQKQLVPLPGGSSVSVQTRGCLADAYRQLIGDVELWAKVHYGAEYFGNLLADKVDSQPEYEEAVAAWRTCMSARGFPDESPAAAQRRLRDKADLKPADEIAVAVADGECALQTHLPATALRVRRQLVATLTDTDRRTLTDLASARLVAIDRATRMASG